MDNQSGSSTPPLGWAAGKPLDKGWNTEEYPRSGYIVLVIYKDGEARGQLRMETQEEVTEWKEMIAQKNLPKNSLKK